MVSLAVTSKAKDLDGGVHRKHLSKLRALQGADQTNAVGASLVRIAETWVTTNQWPLGTAKIEEQPLVEQVIRATAAFFTWLLPLPVPGAAIAFWPSAATEETVRRAVAIIATRRVLRVCAGQPKKRS